MTPAEKAKELIDKYEDVDDCDKHYDDRHSPCSHQAKQCAIICVEQIIESNPYYFYPGRKVTRIQDHSTTEYWQEVLDILKAS